jgi:hypothetical protein
MHKNTRRLFIVSGILPILGVFADPPTVMVILYSIFVFAYLWNENKNAAAEIGKNKWVSLLVNALIVLFVSETLAWLDNSFTRFKNPGALFSTNYIQNLVLGSGFYVGLAFGWFFVSRFYLFTTRQAFCVYGLCGIFLEQSGAVFAQAAAFFFVNPAVSLLLLLYVFLVHGSISGLIYMYSKPVFTGTKNSFLKYPLAFLCLLAGIMIGSVLSGAVSRVLF